MEKVPHFDDEIEEEFQDERVMERNDNRYIEVAYNDVWELSKNGYSENRPIAIIVTAIHFLITQILETLLYVGAYAIVEYLLFGSIDWIYGACFFSLYVSMKKIAYDTIPFSTGVFDTLFGEIEYTPHFPSKWWKIALFILSEAVVWFVL